jgi:hypothetical protein
MPVGGLGALAFNFNNPPLNFIAPGVTLTTNQQRSSPNGSLELLMQGDSNFCLYLAGNPLWCSNTSNNDPGASVTMQTDGNLCIYDPAHVELFCSGTAGNPGAYLLVHDEGYVAIHVGTAIIWRGPPQ